MRFLVDNALSPAIAEGLCRHGHDSVHVRDLGMAAAEDAVIFAHAEADDRVIVSADTDFGTLLALRRKSKPSVILFRRNVDRRPAQQIALLLTNLHAIEDSLHVGCIVVFDESRIRIRMLPVAGPE